MGFFGFKKFNSDEYKELKLQIELLWIEMDVITKRWQRKVTKKAVPDEEKGSEEFNDGFDELRKLNKAANP